MTFYYSVVVVEIPFVIYRILKSKQTRHAGYARIRVIPRLCSVVVNAFHPDLANFDVRYFMAYKQHCKLGTSRRFSGVAYFCLKNSYSRC